MKKVKNRIIGPGTRKNRNTTKVEKTKFQKLIYQPVSTTQIVIALTVELVMIFRALL